MKKISYEEANAELNNILTELKRDSIPLNKLQAKVERAKKLLEICRKALRDTSVSVQSLLEEE